jgi:zeaxanthin glucosyltransferase
VARYLFHSLPLTGHVHPIAAVAGALSARGHEVAWTGSERFLRPLIGPEATVYPTGMPLYRGGQHEHGLAATRSRWTGYIGPHTRFTLPAVDRAVTEYRPQVMVVDQHAVAGALVAHRHRLPWASLAPTSMELTRPYRALPKVEAWILDQLARMWTRAGLAGTPPHDLRFSPHLVIAFTAAALTGSLPVDAELVGPALARRPGVPDFPWARLDRARRLVLATVGTLSLDDAEDFYRRVAEAVRPIAGTVQLIVVAPEDTFPDPPDHVLVVPEAPMLELMPRLAAVICHGGLNTVCEALAHGLPLVVAPIQGDQPINASQVAAAGAGIRVRFRRVRPAELRAAIEAVLDDAAYRSAAERVRASFGTAGGAAAAAAHLERLAGAAT